MISDSGRPEWRPEVIYAFSDGAEQARALAARCRAEFYAIDAHAFPDKESLVTVRSANSAARRRVAVYRSLHDPNAKLLETLLAAAALRAAGARQLVLIAPYLPYMRQDRAFHPGEAVSQQVVGRMLGAAFDCIVTVQPHLHRTRRLAETVKTATVTLNMESTVSAELKESAAQDTIVVGPDEESADLINAIAAAAGLESFTAKKFRLSDTEVRMDLPINVKITGQPIVIVDDIISSGGTIALLARLLSDRGAGPITVYAAHALFGEQAATALKSAGVAQVKSLDGVPHSSNTMSVVDLIAAGLGAGA